MTGNKVSHTNPENNRDRKTSRSERGKLAQRAYRKRHASKFQKLQDDNKSLRAIISRLDTTLCAQGLLSAEVAAILAEARGLCRDDDDDATTCEGAAAATASQKQGADHEPEASRVNMNGHDHDHDVINRQQNVAAIQSHQDVFGQQGNLTTTTTPADANTPPRTAVDNPSHGGGASPPADRQTVGDGGGGGCGAGLVWSWVDSVSLPPGLATCKGIDFRYYLDEGMSTFAGCIFWACVTHAMEVFEDFEMRLAAHEDLCSRGGGGGGAAAAAVATSPELLWQQEPAPAGAETSPLGLTVEPPGYSRILRRFYCRSEHLGEPGYLARLERCRAHYLRCGYVVARRASSRLLDGSSLPADDPWPPMLDDVSGSCSNGGLHQPSHRRACSPWWRTVDEVLLHLEDQIGKDAMARLDAFLQRSGVVMKGADDGTSSARDVEWARRVGHLVLGLAQNYAVYDDGPRWDAVYLSLLTGSWVDYNREWIYDEGARKEGS